MKTLKVAHGVERSKPPYNVKDYKVVNVRNSVEYAPGQILTKDLVADLCERVDWEVVILPLETKEQAR